MSGRNEGGPSSPPFGHKQDGITHTFRRLVLVGQCVCGPMLMGTPLSEGLCAFLTHNGARCTSVCTSTCTCRHHLTSQQPPNQRTQTNKNIGIWNRLNQGEARSDWQKGLFIHTMKRTNEGCVEHEMSKKKRIK